MVYWIKYQGESEYIHISASGAESVSSLSSNAQRTVSDINVLKGLIGSSLSGYIANDKINEFANGCWQNAGPDKRPLVFEI